MEILQHPREKVCEDVSSPRVGCGFGQYTRERVRGGTISL